MQLPDDYNAGPMSLQEFDELKSNEEGDARLLGYTVRVTKVEQGGEIFAQVTFAEASAGPPTPSATTALSPIAGAAAAAIGAGLGATIGGPVVAAAGAAAATALAAGVASSVSSSNTAIARALQDGADQFDVDPKLLAAIAAVESGFNPHIPNHSSSASGLFQFINSTWAEIVRQFGAAVGVQLSDRADIKAQCLMGAALLRQNSDFLRQHLGRTPTNGDCYAAHFLGAATAARLLSGPGNISAADALGARAKSVIDANPAIFMQGKAIRSVAQVIAELSHRVNAAITRGEQFLASG